MCSAASIGFATAIAAIVAPARSRREPRPRPRPRRPGGFGVPFRQDAAELPARRGSRRLLRRHAPAGRRFDQPHRSRRQAGGRDHQARSPGVEGVLSVVGYDFIDGLAASNQAFFVIRLKPYEQRTDPSQSAGAIIQKLRPQLAVGPAGDRVSLQPAADPRSRQHRRLPICARGLARPAAGRHRRDDARHAGHGQPAAGTRGRVQHLRRRHAADLISTSIATRRRCSASRSPTSSTRCNRRSAVFTSTTSMFSAAPGK